MKNEGRKPEKRVAACHQTQKQKLKKEENQTKTPVGEDSSLCPEFRLKMPLNNSISVQYLYKFLYICTWFFAECWIRLNIIVVILLCISRIHSVNVAFINYLVNYQNLYVLNWLTLLWLSLLKCPSCVQGLHWSRSCPWANDINPLIKFWNDQRMDR